MKREPHPIKQMILEKGLRLNFVAQKCCIHPEMFYGYLSGRLPIPDSKLKLICLMADIDPNIFDLNVRNSKHPKAS